MADSQAVLRIAELGLAGKKNELANFLQELAVQEVNNNRRGLYNGIKELLEAYKEIPTPSISQYENTGLELDVSSIWIPKKVEEQINQFVGFYKNRDAANLRTHLSHLNKLLLYGPPGTGKTTIGIYIGHQLNLPVRYVRIADVMSSRFGETLKNIAGLFNSPGAEVIFIDEFDAFGKNRDDSQDVGELKRIVNSIIQTFDFQSQNKIVIVATNLIDSLDPAILRRFAFKIHVGHLSSEDASMFLKFLSSKEDALKFEISVKETEFLISLANLLTIDGIKMLVDKASIRASIENRKKVTFADLLEVLLLEEHISKASLKGMKKDNPIQLKETARILKNKGYTQEDITDLFGIHRNSYGVYFGE